MLSGCREVAVSFMDHLTPEKHSWNMSRVRSENTKPEKAVRSMLHKMGYRFRLHRKDLPGSPDIVLPRYKTVIFVHGCYWHRHQGCNKASMPKTNVRFWKEKFKRNIQRDKLAQEELEKLGWTVIIVWTCELRNMESLYGRLEKSLIKQRVDKNIES